MSECIFCEIVLRREPAYIVYEDDDVIIFLDKYPLSYGHLLIAPKKHFVDIVDTPPNLVSRIFILARAFGVAAMKYLGATGFRIMTNKGSSAGQVVFHFHVHVIPRYGFGSPGPIEPREIIRDDVANEVVKKLSNALNDEEIRDLMSGKI